MVKGKSGQVELQPRGFKLILRPGLTHSCATHPALAHKLVRNMHQRLQKITKTQYDKKPRGKYQRNTNYTLTKSNPMPCSAISAFSDGRAALI